MHSSRMRTVRSSSRLCSRGGGAWTQGMPGSGGGDWSGGKGVCSITSITEADPPREQNDRQV